MAKVTKVMAKEVKDMVRTSVLLRDGCHCWVLSIEVTDADSGLYGPSWPLCGGEAEVVKVGSRETS